MIEKTAPYISNTAGGKPKSSSQENHQGHLNKIAKGASINFTGDVAGKAMLFLITLVLARSFSNEHLGVYFLGLSIIQVLSKLGLMGLGIGVVRFVSISSADLDDAAARGIVIGAVTLSLFLSSLIAGVLFAMREWMATTLLSVPEVSPILGCLSLAVPFEASTNILLSATRGLKYMHYTVIVEKIIVLGSRLAFVLLLVILMAGGVEGAAMAYLFASVVGLGFAFYYCNRIISITKFTRPPKALIIKLLAFSLPMLPTSFVRDLAKELDILMLSWLAPISAVGIYSIALRLIGFTEAAFRAFRGIFDPFIADMHHKGETANLAKMYKLITRWSLMTSLPLFVLVILYPSFFMGLFNDTLTAGASCLSLLIVAHLFSAFSGPASSMIFMSGRPYLSFTNNVCYLLVKFILNLLLIPRLLMVGAAAAHGLAITMLAAARIVEVVKLMRLHPFQSSLSKPLLASIAGMTPLYLFTGIDPDISVTMMFIVTFSFLSLYTLFLVLMRLDNDDRYILRQIKMKILRVKFTPYA